MMYTLISEETVKTARNRLLEDLNVLTDGSATVAMDYVKAIMELDSILKEQQREENEKTESTC